MSKAAMYTAAVLVGLSLAIVVWRLADAESASGSAYPAYSSHRADAQGLKALFDVAELTGHKVAREYTPLRKDRIHNSLVVVLGLSPITLVTVASAGADSAAELAGAGNTVVLGLTGDCQKATIKDWSLAMECAENRTSFKGPGWTQLRDVRDASASIVERQFGSGTIILMGDSRLLNNGSLARQSRGELLRLLLERHPAVVFDEGHLGVTDAVSTGALIRRYRLHGVLAAILLLFGAFVWKNASSFLPQAEATNLDIIGRDSSSGLANLLRRTVPSRDVVRVAVAEWAKGNKDDRRTQEINRIAAAHTNPAEAYNAVVNALHRKRTID